MSKRTRAEQVAEEIGKATGGRDHWSWVRNSAQAGYRRGLEEAAKAARMLAADDDINGTASWAALEQVAVIIKALADEEVKP
jgi:hypothetical protein